MMQHRHYPLLPGCYLGEDTKSKEDDIGVEKKVLGHRMLRCVIVNAKLIHVLADAIPLK